MYAKLLSQIREENKLTQQQMADFLGISRPTLALIEQGTNELTISQVKKICDSFNISLESFLQGVIQPVAEVELEEELIQLTEPEIRISVPQEKIAIFKQVLLYILNQVGGKPSVGQTVLYKLLYFIDFDYYEKYEEQLIGARYIRNHHGPTPLEFKKIVEKMIRDGDLEEVKSEYFNHAQTKYLPRKKADLSSISGRAKEHIDFELARLSDMNATQLSALSHQDVPWIIAQPSDVLDYEAVFYRTPETSQRAYDSDNV